MAYEYYPSGQFQTLAEERHHDDSFLGEAILITQAADMDISDFMRQDIITGNTHTVGSAFKKINRVSDFGVVLWNGTRFPDVSLDHGEITKHTMYSMIPIKDDYSGDGYYKMPDDDPRKKQVEKSLKAMKMKLDDISTPVLDPEPIPDVGTKDFKPYQDLWDSSSELQSEYPTIEAYHDKLVEDLRIQKDTIPDISDVFTGIGVIGSSLAETNVVAMYFTMAHIYPQITYNGQMNVRPENFPFLDYLFEYNADRFQTVNGFTGWSHIIRQGVVIDKFDEDPHNPKWSKNKSTFKFYTGDDAHRNALEGDPIVDILVPNILEDSWSSLVGRASGLLEIQVQLTSDTYGEIRVWDYGTLHAITANDGHIVTLFASIGGGTVNIGDGGTGEVTTPDEVTVPDGTVDIIKFDSTGGIEDQYQFDDGYDEAYFDLNYDGTLTAKQPLDYAVKDTYYLRIAVLNDSGIDQYFTFVIHVENTNSEPEPPPSEDPFGDHNDQDNGYDLVFFPIEFKAAKKVSFFKRERFLRESVIMGVYATKKVKLKWYQSGWFKVVMFIAAIVLAWVTAGASLNIYVIIETAIHTVIMMVVSMAISSFLENVIDAPFLAAILIMVVAYYGGQFNLDTTFTNLADVASSAMHAGQMYEKKQFQNKMEDLQKEMKEFKESMNDMDEELESMMEQYGQHMREDAAGFVRYLTQLARVETSEDFFDSKLNIDNAIIDDMDNSLDIDDMLKVW